MIHYHIVDFSLSWAAPGDTVWTREQVTLPRQEEKETEAEYATRCVQYLHLAYRFPPNTTLVLKGNT